MAEEKRLEPAWTDTGQTHQTDKSKKDIGKTSSEKTDINEEKQLGQVQIDITKFLLTEID